MQRSTAPSASAALARTRGALSRRENWLQLIRFCVVGASGYVVNLAVYTLLLKAGDVHYLLAATGSFLVAVTSNYTWNRLWTFRGQRGHVAYQGLRFLVVSTIALAANLVILHAARRRLRRRQGARAGDRDRARDPVELRGEQALVLRTRLPALAAALAALAFAALGRGGDGADRAGVRQGRAARRDSVRSHRGQRSPDRGTGDRDPLPQRQGRRLARPLPAEAGDGRRVSAGSGRVGGEGLVGQGGPDRAREGRRPHRRGEGGLDRAAGRLVDGARRRGRVRRQDDQRRLALAGASARSSSSASPTCGGRSRSATSTCWRCSRSRSRSASSTRARSSGARRSPTRRSCTCSVAASGS